VIRTLVVDDDFRVADIHAAYVAKMPGFEATDVAYSAAGARESIRRIRPDLMLLDLYLPDEHGLSLLRSLHDQAGPHPDVIVITAARDVPSVRAAMKLGAVHYLVKPFGFERLAEQLRAYQQMTQHSSAVGDADQRTIDQMFAMLRTPSSEAPKGQSAPTTALVKSAFEGAEELSAAEVAKRVGVSRATAQRYLAQLVRDGSLELRLRYGPTGRPEHLYRQISVK
jgi:response regulator of citrate/malate metabolism